MAKMMFAKTVKYNGTKYPPNTQFEVLEEDVQDLKTAGGWVVEKAIKEAEQVIEEQPTEEPVEEVATEEDKSEVDKLRERAIELGIDFKGNWGVPKLTEAIKEAEQA